MCAPPAAGVPVSHTLASAKSGALAGNDKACTEAPDRCSAMGGRIAVSGPCTTRPGYFFHLGRVGVVGMRSAS